MMKVAAGLQHQTPDTVRGKLPADERAGNSGADDDHIIFTVVLFIHVKGFKLFHSLTVISEP